MHIEEAEWIKTQLGSLHKEKISPLLNIGSSTEEFRVRQQPHIDALIFKPLRDANVVVVHQDIKSAPGVDIIGDLTEEAFLNRLRAMQFQSVICSNLLEHVVNRQEIADALLQIIPLGAYLVVTVPSHYPKHLDPIDTMYRPSIDELATLFRGANIVDSELIDVGTVWDSISTKPAEFFKLVIRLGLPFYKPDGWVTAFNRTLWMFRRRKITCILLKKEA
jgi:hypothetical protein